MRWQQLSPGQSLPGDSDTVCSIWTCVGTGRPMFGFMSCEDYCLWGSLTSGRRKGAEAR